MPAQDVSYSGFDLEVAALPDLIRAGQAPDVASWQRFARLVAEAARGDASGFADLLGQPTVGNTKVPSFIGMNATHCPDGRGFADYAEFRRIKALRTALPPLRGCAAMASARLRRLADPRHQSSC